MCIWIIKRSPEKHHFFPLTFTYKKKEKDPVKIHINAYKKKIFLYFSNDLIWGWRKTLDTRSHKRRSESPGEGKRKEPILGGDKTWSGSSSRAQRERRVCWITRRMTNIRLGGSSEVAHEPASAAKRSAATGRGREGELMRQQRSRPVDTFRTFCPHVCKLLIHVLHFPVIKVCVLGKYC